MRTAVVGGTGGIGRAVARLLAARGAEVTVVGQTFRDAGTPGLSFEQADLSRMSEAERVAHDLDPKTLDVLVLTTGVMAPPARQQTAEGVEMDMAISYLSRLVIVRNVADELGSARTPAGMRPRIAIWGYPGVGQTARLDDLNFERDYSAMKAHMSTVAGNEALVLDAAERYPDIDVFGMNPGAISTNIRANMLGPGSRRQRAMETVLGWVTQSAEQYAGRVVPLLVSPDLSGRSGAMFDSKGRAIHRSVVMTPQYVRDVIHASE